MHLIILNYSMRPSSLVFGHQREVVIDLAKLISAIDVVTGEVDLDSPVFGVRILDANWRAGKHWSNVTNFLLRIVPLLLASKIKHNKTVIFSHMTEVQSALIAPFAKVLKIPHFLWYAHTKKSLYLRWCHFWITGIISSTKDSCPYSDRKVHIVGQSIDEGIFKYVPPKHFTLKNGVYVGRFDKSKRLESLIQLLRDEAFINFPIVLTLVGSPTPGNEDYWENLLSRNSDLMKIGRLNVMSKVPNRDLPLLLRQFDFFVNAFDGSLDKTLVEATLLGIPVVTVNPPYLAEFGSWSRSGTTTNPEEFLRREFLALCNFNRRMIENELLTRYTIASENHSRNKWVVKIYNLLTSA